MALTIAVCWLCLVADTKPGVATPNWKASVVTWGKAGLALQALAYIDDCAILPKVLEATKHRVSISSPSALTSPLSS